MGSRRSVVGHEKRKSYKTLPSPIPFGEFLSGASGYAPVPKNPCAPAWKARCTLGNEVLQHIGSRAPNSLTLGFLLQSDLELIKNVNAAVSLQSLPQLCCYTSKTVLQGHFDINRVKPLLWITFPFPNAVVGPADWWSAWHMKHISPLIFFGTVWSKPTAAAVKWGRASLSKTNKFSLCLGYTKLCKLFHATWEEIRWLSTLLAFENDITKNIYLCVSGWGCSWHRQTFPFFPPTAWDGQQWNTCGPE